MLIPVLAFVSGIPALIYQVVWTREISLIVGGQIEAISLVLVAFFGGLAFGAKVLGARVDRVASPLRAYGIFEITAGTLAIASIPSLRFIGTSLPAVGAEEALSWGGTFLIFPITFLLGGTTPALLRAAVHHIAAAPEHAGRLTGANTAGAVLGVCIAIGSIPRFGLQATMWCAGGLAIIIGFAALYIGRKHSLPSLGDATAERTERGMPPIVPLLAAFLAGTATLAFEVLAARMAGLLLGSSLYAWGAVLGVTLIGLASGNFWIARRAAKSESPHRDFAHIELLAALSILIGLSAISPEPTTPSLGLTLYSFALIFCGVYPPAVAMGAAFPFFVRLSAKNRELGSAFGAVSAANTAGGILGAVGASFYLLPALGPVHGAVLCALLNGLIGLGFLAQSESRKGRAREASVAICGAIAIGLFVTTPPELPPYPQLIHLSHGRQATAAVVIYGDRRDLLVDGDPEASTASQARATEEFLAILPLMLHPQPERFLEVGLGSGTTFGTASLFPLEMLECVEIAESVLSAAPFFAPDNRGIATTSDPRVHILNADGRAHLLKRQGQFDVVVANTLHPWSLGATGLYSWEYFERLSKALKQGGIAAQWLPLGVIGAEHLASILRSFYSSFEFGTLYWGAENVMLVGSNKKIEKLPRLRFDKLAPRVWEALQRVGIADVDDFNQRRIADLPEILKAIGPGDKLTDDLPALESRIVDRTSISAEVSENELLERIAQFRVKVELGGEPMVAWMASRSARSRGDTKRANALEARSEKMGFNPARRSRLIRTYAAVDTLDRDGKSHEALRRLQAIVAEAPTFSDAWYSIALIERGNEHYREALSAMRRVVELDPMRGEAWNILGLLSWQAGDLNAARRAFQRAIEAAPFFPKALLSMGGFALSQRDFDLAEEMSDRLDRLGGLGPLPEALQLRKRIEMKRRL